MSELDPLHQSLARVQIAERRRRASEARRAARFRRRRPDQDRHDT